MITDIHFIVGSHDGKLGNMLMTPKDNNGSKKRSAKKRDEGDKSEEETARLLTEDPLDWMLKNEHVGSMLSVSKKFRKLKTLQMFLLSF